MRRLLYVAPFCHIPAVHGASQRGINLLQQLASHQHTTLLTYRKHDAAALQQWADAHGILVRWLPDPPARENANLLRRVAARRPPGFASHDPQAVAGAIDRAWADQGPFDTVYFATQLLGQAALVKRWPARMILDLYDIYTPIAYSKIDTVPIHRPYHWLFWLEAARVRRYERRVVERFDQLLVPALEDAGQLAKTGVDIPVAIVPNGVCLPEPASFQCLEHTLLMVGSYTYAPNAEGIRWFYQQVWPIIRKRAPHISLTLVGEGEHELSQLTSGDRQVQWAGKVPDLRGYYEAAGCVIVPIQSGGGTRLKLLEAMAWGVPVVSTSLGAQGIEHGQSIGIADRPEQFAEAVIDRLQRPDAYSAQVEYARTLVEQQYTWNRIGATLVSLLGSFS